MQEVLIWSQKRRALARRFDDWEWYWNAISNYCKRLINRVEPIVYPDPDNVIRNIFLYNAVKSRGVHRNLIQFNTR